MSSDGSRVPVSRCDGSEHLAPKPGVSAESRREASRRMQTRLILGVDVLLAVVAALAVKAMFDSTNPAFSSGDVAAVVVVVALVLMALVAIVVPISLNKKRWRMGVSFAIESPFYRNGERTDAPAPWAEGADYTLLKELDACEATAIRLDEVAFSSSEWADVERDLYRLLKDVNTCVRGVTAAQRSGADVAPENEAVIKALRACTALCGSLRKSGDAAVARVRQQLPAVDVLVAEAVRQVGRL